jgi:putative tryptophan/tyrosine transport system substrate-binding protein
MAKKAVSKTKKRMTRIGVPKLFAHVPGRPVVAILHTGSRNVFRRQIEEFKDSLEDAGLEIDEDVEVVEYWNEDRTQQALTTLATTLFNDIPVADLKVVVAAGGPASALTAKNVRGAGPTPIVFTTILDPVRAGILNNLQTPDTNMTGMAGLTTELDVERLHLLLDLLQGNVTNVGVLYRPSRVDVDHWLQKLHGAAQRMNPNLVLKEGKADTEQQIKQAFQFFRAPPAVQAVLVTADPLFNSKRKLVVKLAADKSNVGIRQPLPAIYQWREFVAVGGLMSYGPTMTEAYRHAGVYAARIVGDGTPPSNLPVVYPTEFELAINKRTAASLNVTISPEMRARAILFPRGR